MVEVMIRALVKYLFVRYPDLRRYFNEGQLVTVLAQVCGSVSDWAKENRKSITSTLVAFRDAVTAVLRRWRFDGGNSGVVVGGAITAGPAKASPSQLDDLARQILAEAKGRLDNEEPAA
jgi:hypothetical protein